MSFLASILLFVIRFYMILISIRIFTSWLSLPYNKYSHYLSVIVDPVLNFFKRVFPLKIGFLDLSPLVPLLLLSLADTVVVDLLINNQVFGIGFIAGKLIFILKYCLNVAVFIFCFSCIIILVMNIFMPMSYNPIVTMMRSFLDPIMSKLRRIFKIHSYHSDRIYLIILIVFTIIVSMAGNYLLDFLAYQAVRLRF